jgi:hypothetical protein
MPLLREVGHPALGLTLARFETREPGIVAEEDSIPVSVGSILVA